MSSIELSTGKQRTKCEIYSRIVGYLRPVGQWNDGKQSEYYDRKNFVIKPDSVSLSGTTK